MACGVVLGATLATPGLASAATTTYPGGTSDGTVSSGTVHAGGPVEFRGSGFAPNESISITESVAPLAKASAALTTTEVPVVSLAMYRPAARFVVALAASSSEIAQTTADATGAFALDIHLTTPGLVTLTAKGNATGHTATATVTVLATTSTGGTGTGGTGGTGTGSGTTDNGASGGKGGGLVRTGPAYDIATAAWLATGAIGLGIGFLVLTRAKRRDETAAV
jgi:hypothetical protein